MLSHGVVPERHETAGTGGPTNRPRPGVDRAGARPVLNLRRHWLAPAIGLALALVAGAPALRAQDAPAPPPGEGATEQHFGSWTLRCFPPSQSLPRRCEMVQVLGDTQTKEELLLMAVGYPDPQSGPIAWLVLPLGILLPPGLGLKIDQGETRGLPIRSCDPRGCATPWPLSDADIAALKQGKELVVIFQDIDGKKLGLPVSLQGFTAAFSQLR